MEGVDDVAFLAGSEPRATVVAELAEEGPLRKDDLVDRSGAARVTITRNLEQLADRGVVADGQDGWRLTPLGELLAEEFLSLLSTAETAGELGPLLRRLPPAAFDLDPAALSGADVTTSTPAHPYAPAERHAETMMSADRARLLLPAVSPQQMADTEDRMRAGDLEVEIIAAPSVAATFRTAASDLVAAVTETGAVTIHEHDGPVPFFLGIVDGVVQIGAADEEGIPRALAESTDERVRTWAEATLDEYLAAATPFELDPDD